MGFVLKVLVFGFLMCWECKALSWANQESSFLHSVCTFVELYEEEFGELPSSWEELDRMVPDPPDAFLGSRAEMRERYAFLPEGARPRLPAPGGELFLISRRPFRDTSMELGLFGRTIRLTEPLRYGVKRIEGGMLRLVRFEEAEVQELFAGQGIALPEPDDLPERPWVTELKRRKRDSRMLLAGVLVSGGFIAYCVFRKPR